MGREEKSASNADLLPQCSKIKDSRTAMMMVLTLRKSREETLSTIRGRPDGCDLLARDTEKWGGN